MRARTALNEEYVATEALVDAAARHISGAELDSLLGINFEADLSAARRSVDSLTVLLTMPSLAAQYKGLLSLRTAELHGSASFGDVQRVFGKLDTAIDAQAVSLFASVSKQTEATAPADLRRSLAQFDNAFTAFTSGAQEVWLTTAILTAASTATQVEELITSQTQFDTAVAGFPAQLGPRAGADWETLEDSPYYREFAASVRLAIGVGLHGLAPPYPANLRANSGAFTAELALVAALTKLVLAASTDLTIVTSSAEGSATVALAVDLLAAMLLLTIEIGGATVLSRALGRRLAHIVVAASAVNAGDFDVPPLDETGPREFVVAAQAFNAMSSTLRAVEAHVVALAAPDFDHQTLAAPPPGRVGKALQAALELLHGSMRADEQTRNLLHDRAIHDSFTGLLNRGAAVETLERWLVEARDGQQAVVLLFIDLDGLKAINDTFGHEGGDAAIRAVADALRAATRPTDMVARLGGDEFVVAWLDTPDGAGPSLMAERVRRQVSASRIFVGEQRIDVTCSIGIALSLRSDMAVDVLMNRADQALYQAKAAGRNRIGWLRPPHDKRYAASSRRSARS